MYRKISIKELMAFYGCSEASAKREKAVILASLGKSGNVLTVVDFSRYTGVSVRQIFVDLEELGFRL